MGAARGIPPALALQELNSRILVAASRWNLCNYWGFVFCVPVSHISKVIPLAVCVKYKV